MKKMKRITTRKMKKKKKMNKKRWRRRRRRRREGITLLEIHWTKSTEQNCWFSFGLHLFLLLHLSTQDVSTRSADSQKRCRSASRSFTPVFNYLKPRDQITVCTHPVFWNAAGVQRRRAPRLTVRGNTQRPEESQRRRRVCGINYSVETIMAPDVLLNPDVTCSLGAQCKAKGGGMQPWL